MAIPLRRELLEHLLRDGQVRRAPATAPGPPRPVPTGVPAREGAVGGGLGGGQLHELVGPPGAGGTALLCAALASATFAGELCALIDPGNAFDPARRGIDLSRLLWVRPRDPVQALRAAEIALEARFSLVALDLGDVSVLPPPRRPRGVVEVVRFEKRSPSPGASPWARLARRAGQHRGRLFLPAPAPHAGALPAGAHSVARRPARAGSPAGPPPRVP